jgi:hypothetical protein
VAQLCESETGRESSESLSIGSLFGHDVDKALNASDISVVIDRLSNFNP